MFKLLALNDFKTIFEYNYMPFTFEQTNIPDVQIITPEVFEDQRGYFLESYVKEEFKEAGIENDFIQDNCSYSTKHVLRGLHYQKNEQAQAKLVRCTTGKILDVAVDLRKDSETFKEHFAIDLSAENKKMLFVPKGFAHGFLVLSDQATVHYKVDNPYAPDKEAGIHWNDPNLNIDWPIEDPNLSDNDREWPTLEEAKEHGLLF